jgi:hypothetical protein
MQTAAEAQEQCRSLVSKRTPHEQHTTSKFAAAWYKPKWQEMRLNMGKPCRFKNQERQSSRDQSAAPVASAPYPETAPGGWRVGPTAQSHVTCYTHAARPGSHPLQLSLCIDMLTPPPSRHMQMRFRRCHVFPEVSNDNFDK